MKWHDYVYFFSLCLLGLFSFVQAFSITASDRSISATVTNSQVYLTWEVTYGTNYEVLRSNTKGGYFSVIKTNLVETGWVDSPEETEKTYYYKVVVYDPETREVRKMTQEIGVYIP